MKRTAPLSERENKIWEYILRYFEDHTYSPTRKEIADGIGLETPQEVEDCLQNMVKKCWLKLDQRKWRNIIDPKDYGDGKM